MANWKRLEVDDLRVILSEDEIQTLKTISLDDSKVDVVQEMIDMASDLFRGAFVSKGYPIDVRDHYSPLNYKHFILIYARWSMWSRFPMSPSIALDEARKQEWNLACDMLKDPRIGVESPEWKYSSENPDNGKVQAGSIGLPFMRIDQEMFDSWVLDDRILEGQGMFCR